MGGRSGPAKSGAEHRVSWIFFNLKGPRTVSRVLFNHVLEHSPQPAHGQVQMLTKSKLAMLTTQQASESKRGVETRNTLFRRLADQEGRLISQDNYSMAWMLWFLYRTQGRVGGGGEEIK